MTFKMGSLGLSTFAGENKTSVLSLDGGRSKNERDKFAVPSKISVQARLGENPLELHKRMLREAASRAGLDATDAQEKFVAQYAEFGIDFADPQDDPSPSDGMRVKTGEIENKNASYALQPDQIASLKSLQKEYVAAGGKLHGGKSYQSAPNETAAAKQATNNAAQQQRAKLERLLRDAQILPTAFGTPSKLRDLKHISVALPKELEAGLSNEDHALLAYLQKTYGKGNLHGDDIKEILDLSKKNGVRAENLKIENGTAEFDASVENLLKMYTAYIAVQAKTNALIDSFQKTADNSVASRFMQGVFEGAWEDLKANGQAIADPIGTASKLAEIVRQLASIDPILLGKAIAETAANAPVLLEQGTTAVANMKAGDAAEAAGRLVGTAATEAVLAKGTLTAFKGIAFLGKTESGMRLLQQIGGATQKAKAAIGALEIPMGAKAVEIALEGGKIKLPVLETKRLDEIILQMKSSEKLGMLEKGSTAGKQTIKETAESGLSETAQSGIKHLKGEIPKAVAAEAKQQLVTLNVARTELMAKLDDLIKTGNILPDAKDRLKTAYNGLKDHLKQDDLVGALRDRFGKDVRKSGSGKIFDHAGEVQDGLEALDNAKDILRRELNHKPKGSSDFIRLSKDLDAIKEMQRKVQTFLELQ